MYTFCRDEELLLPYFFQHYNFADKIICFYDINSTDRSEKIIHRNKKCKSIKVDFNGKFRDDFLMYAKNSEWKESKGIADWVIVVDMDEFVYHPENLVDYLHECEKRGNTIPKIKGYEMHSDTFPAGSSPLVRQIRFGAPSEKFNKLCVFNPNAIENINYEPGAHICHPEGNILTTRTAELMLLHYKFIGGLKYILNRWNAFGHNLSAENLKYHWSISRLDEQSAIDRYHYIKQRKNKVIAHRHPL